MTNVCLNLKFRSWEMGHFSVRTVKSFEEDRLGYTGSDVFSGALACSISDKARLKLLRVAGYCIILICNIL